MNTVILKINSFKPQNTVLINGKPVLMNSEFMNYYSKPILDVAEKLFETFEAEFNDYYTLEVYGNKFEQAFIKAVAQGYELCTEVKTFDCAVNIPVAERISLLGRFLNGAVTIGCSLCTDLRDLALPQVENVTVENDKDQRIVVSDDISFIADNTTPKTRAAFLIDGKTKKRGKTYIIGCSRDEIVELLRDFVSTQYINPIIGIVSKNIHDSADPAKIADCTDPYYYTESKLSVVKGKDFSFVINSLPENVHTGRISLRLKGDCIVPVKGLTFHAEKKGLSAIEILTDSPIPAVVINVEVQEFNYVKSISLGVAEGLTTLCVGRRYKLNIELSPDNAEDVASLAVKTSDNRIAEYRDGFIEVKSVGDFRITATTTDVESTLDLSAKNKVSKIALSTVPKEMFPGDIFEIKTAVYPADAFDSRYKWITGNKNVAVVGRTEDGRIMIKAVGTGTTTISCVSADDQTVRESVDVAVASTFSRKGTRQSLLFLAAFSALITLLFSYWGLGMPRWATLGAAGLFLLISLFRGESVPRQFISLILVLAALAGAVSMPNKPLPKLVKDPLEAIFGENHSNVPGKFESSSDGETDQVVPEEPTYNISPEQISKEWIKGVADQFVAEVAAKNIEENEDPSNSSIFLGEPVYDGTYLLLKNESAVFAEYENCIIVFARYDFNLDGKYLRTEYDHLTFSNVLAAPNEMVMLDYDDGSSNYPHTDFNGETKESKGDYTVIKLD